MYEAGGATSSYWCTPVCLSFECHHHALCQIPSVVLNYMAVGSNCAAPGSPCIPDGSESALSCLTARGDNHEGQTGCCNDQF